MLLNQKHITGVFSLIGAALLFSLYGVYNRYMGNNFGPFFQTWSRSLLISLIITLVMSIEKKYLPISKSELPWFLLFAGSAALMGAPFYLATIYLPLGLTLFIMYATSTIVSYVLGMIVFKEKLDSLKIGSLILALIGLIFLFSDSFGFTNKFVIFAVLSGVFYALYCVFSKRVSDRYPLSQMVLVLSLIQFLVNFVISMFIRDNTNYQITSFPWIINIIYAITSIGTSYLIPYGFRRIEVQKGSIILLSELIFVIIVSYLFFREIPTLNAFIGGGFILISMLLPNLNLRLCKKINLFIII